MSGETRCLCGMWREEGFAFRGEGGATGTRSVTREERFYSHVGWYV